MRNYYKFVLLNLLLNAESGVEIQFSKPNRKVELKIRSSANRRLHIGSR
jgi:hypothetical protein